MNVLTVAYVASLRPWAGPGNCGRKSMPKFLPRGMKRMIGCGFYSGLGWALCRGIEV